MLALADCTNFYVSCERVFAPSLRTRPVVVLSNNDGTIISRCPVCREHFTMGQPYYQARPQLEQLRAAVLSSNYALYGDMSRRVMQTLAQFSPELEIYSIDEAFVDLGTPADPRAIALQMRQMVLQHTGIPIGVGIAPTKTLAKVASKQAKRNPDSEGVWVLADASAWQPVLARYPVGDVWGIGRQHRQRLEQIGVHTALDLAQLPDAWVRKHMAVVGLRTVWELRGIPCLGLELESDPKKGITVSRAFGHRLTELRDLEEALATYVTRAGEKLRKERLLARTMFVWLNTNPYAQDADRDPFYAPARTFQLSRHTNYTPELIEYAMWALRQMYRPGFKYKKCGVILTDLVIEGSVPQSLFDTRDTGRESRVMQAVDTINRRMGWGAVRYAVAGMQQAWRMASEMRSPAYTTQWAELPLVGA